ncbi:hypothetical protein NQ318_022407 [Aromia moschata]|uniref:Uncharacterized protein n=1 Tax=Aromia moschata TaxID=1265417 RepID=A0AAV8Z7G6_9CUCU|nr:hypothetical protein NQ318_022407 [Aromia moschata]
MYPSPVPNTPSQNGALPTSPFNGGLQYTPFFNGVRPHSPSYNASSHRFSFNSSEYRLARTESTNSNKELIEELKVKLMKTNSIKEAVTENIYKECQNLDEILEAHDRTDTYIAFWKLIFSKMVDREFRIVVDLELTRV